MNLTWLLIVSGLSVLLLITGFIRAKKINNKKEQTILIRRFACAAMMPIFLYLVFSLPYVSNAERTEIGFREQTSEKTMKDLESFEKDQTRKIELLNEEVLMLREEVHEMNEYYRFFALILLTVASVFCLVIAWKGNRIFGEPSDNA